VKGLAGTLGRDYKNVHVDTAELEAVDLIQRTEDGLVVAPWDVALSFLVLFEVGTGTANVFH